MVRTPYIDGKGFKRGAWSEEEDNKLREYILRYKAWNWNHLPRFAGLARCGKSCRMRWENYLKPGVKRGGFSKDDEELIFKMQKQHGNKWSLIAKKMPGRTDNEIKNYWHTILSKRTKQDLNLSASVENATKTISDENREHDVDADWRREEEITSTSCNGNGTHSKLETIGASKEPKWNFGKEVATLMTTDLETDALSMLVDMDMDNAQDSPHPQLIYSRRRRRLNSTKTLGSLANEPVNSSNTKEAPTSFTLAAEDPEESFSATLHMFSMDDISSSETTDFYPWTINFPSTSYNSGMETQNSWSPDDNTSAFTKDVANSSEFSTSTEFQTSTLLTRLDSLESFGFWKALWNFLK